MRFCDFYKHTPSYAILSHTWSKEEVSYQDMLSGQAKSKKGYAKVEGCCKQALKDRIKYIWIDTCCIDKTSSTELSEAINSMFRWYAGAVVCYAHLSDVPSPILEEEGDSQDHNAIGKINTSKLELRGYFEKSRWFTRGWTLQELLAPSRLVFFSADWRSIGEREEWRKSISTITNIHSDALKGDPDQIAQFSLAQRMSWASNRVTTREEDMAYCLFGLFDINMPMLYGEGGERAFLRLQEEIIKTSDDQSLFSWSVEAGAPLIGLLAPRPSLFVGCGDIVPLKSWRASEPYSMTNSGLRITGLLARTLDFNQSHQTKFPPDSDHILMIKCCSLRKPERMIGIFVKEIFPGGDQFARVRGSLAALTGDFCSMDMLFSKEIYIRKQIALPTKHQLAETGNGLFFKVFLSPVLKVKEVYPPVQLEQLGEGKGVIVFPPASGPVRSVVGNWTWYVTVLIERRFEQRNFCFVLFLGYDGINSCGWCGTSPFSDAGPHPLNKIWYSGCDTRYSVGSEFSFDLSRVSSSLEIAAEEVQVIVGRK
jgi:hypothetical protein